MENDWIKIYYKYLPADGQMETFYRSIKFIVVFRVNMCIHVTRVFPARAQSWNVNSPKERWKKNRFKQELKVIFHINFLRLSKEVKTLRKERYSEQSYQATSREDIREAHTNLPIALLNHYSHQPVMSWLEVIFPNRNYQSHWMEYNYNW